MDKVLKNKFIVQILIVIAVVALLMPIALSISININKVGQALGNSINNVEQMAAPSVTNGGSGSSSSGGDTIKKIQYVTVECDNNWNNGAYTRTYAISSVDPLKTDVILPEGINMSYSLTSTVLTFNSSYAFVPKNYTFSEHCLCNKNYSLTEDYNHAFFGKVTVKLIEYN